jgi:hypothetical protein
MKRKVVFGAVAALAVTLALTTTWVTAQNPGPGGRGPRAGAMTDQLCPVGPMHEAMEEAIAGALGITHDELEAALAAGRTVPQIAQERGVAFTAVQAAVQQLHQQYGMPGPYHRFGGMMGGYGMMGGRGMMGGQVGGPNGAGCPFR